MKVKYSDETMQDVRKPWKIEWGNCFGHLLRNNALQGQSIVSQSK